MNPRGFVDVLIIEPLDVIDLVECHEVFQFYLFEHVGSLLSERGAIHQKENPLKSVCGQETIDHAENGSGLSRSCCHRQQDVFSAARDGLFRRLDGIHLIGSQIQPARICEKVVGQGF